MTLLNPWLWLAAVAIYLGGVGSGMLWSKDRAEARKNREAVAQLTADIKAQQDQAARLHKAKESTDDELQKARAAADRARVGLREYAAAQQARIATSAPDCTAANAAAAVYADLFGRADTRAGELAAEADERRARGLGCEQHYQAITERTP